MKPYMTRKPGEILTIDGMAHFSGGGPPGAACGECANWIRKQEGVRNLVGCCAKYLETHRRYNRRLEIPRTTPACKFFQEYIPKWRRQP
jgi:hypothetical protein